MEHLPGLALAQEEGSLSPEAHAARMREWRAAHPGYDKRGYRGTVSQKLAEKKYKSSEKGKENNRSYLRKGRIDSPEKPRSRDAVKHALKTGKLTKPDACECCAEAGSLHAHHEDYSKPLSVAWLCPKCHTEVHKNK